MKRYRSFAAWAAAGIGLLLLFLAPAGTPARSALAQANGSVCGPMDVAFIIDDTGSMGGALGNVNSELAGILGDIATASGNDYRLALLSFKDNITIHDNFAANNAGVVGPDITALTAGGGAGEPEASDEALNTAVNTLPAAGRPQNIDFTPAYRAGALKLAIVVTDARPAGFDDSFGPADLANVTAVSTQAAALGIKVSGIHVPGSYDATTAAVLTEYATTTGGLYRLTAPDGTGTGQAIKDIIAACGSGTGPDLVITKEAKPGQPAPTLGGKYAFIIKVKNIGNRPTPPPPTDVMLRDDLSGVGSFAFWVASAGKCSSSAPFVNCRRGAMAPGEVWTVEIGVRLPATCGTWVNRAVVDPWNLIKELNEGNNAVALAVPPPAACTP